MSGEYVQAAHWRARRPGSVVDRVIIHTAQGTYTGTLMWFASAKSPASAHYVIGEKGQIAQCVPDDMAAFHAGSKTERGWNDRSIGIEHAGYVDDGKPPSEAMLRASAMVCAKMCHDFGIPVDRQHIIGHVEVPGATHTDPGAEWPWDHYIALVGMAYVARAWVR